MVYIFKFRGNIKFLSICAYTFTYMTKVISLSDEAYKTLKKLKRKNESFSDVIMRIVKGMETKPLTDFAGRWVGNDLDKIFKKILHERETIKTRELKI